MKLDTIYNMDYAEGLRLVDDGSVDLVVTDPPYWHHKSPGKPYSQRKQSRTESKFSNSSLYSQDCDMMRTMSDFDDKSIYRLLDSLKPKMKIYNGYFFCSESQVPYYCLWADRNGLMFSILVWEKPLSIINKNRFSQNLEYVVRVYDYGTALNRVDDNELYNRVSHDKVVLGKDKRHPTEKPVDVMAKYLELSSKPGDVVLDPFMGSGTSAVACSRLGRHYVGFEIDKGFYDKAVKRVGYEAMDQSRELFGETPAGRPGVACDTCSSGINDEDFE